MNKVYRFECGLGLHTCMKVGYIHGLCPHTWAMSTYMGYMSTYMGYVHIHGLCPHTWAMSTYMGYFNKVW